MDCEELREILNREGATFSEKPAQGGTRFDCAGGEIFNVFETGKMSFQGRKQDTPLAQTVKALYEGNSSSPTRTPSAVGTTVSPIAPVSHAQAQAPVFVVYGHDIGARDQLELLLRRMGLDPVILGSLNSEGDTIIEKLERYLGEHGNIGFACVLLTPDDEGFKAGKPGDKKYRARQNVVLELGMVLTRLGRRRVAILHKQSIELPSDINGLLYIGFTERIDEVKPRLFNELRAAGYDPNSSALN